MKRHKKSVESARCCWVCGKLGGAGFTSALRALGYEVPKDAVAHAHPECVRRVQLKKKESQ